MYRFIFTRYFRVNKYNKTFSLKDLKVELTMFYRHHFAFSSIHKLISHRLNKGSQLMVGQGVLLPVDIFTGFYIGLSFTSV